METKNKLYETENKLEKAGDDTNEKAKYIDELEKNQEKFDYQNAKIIECESELNEKDKYINTLKKDINDLENKNIEIMIEKNSYYEKKERN